MPISSISNAAAYGIIADTPANELPPEAWSAGLNVRIRDRVVGKIPGHSTVYDPPVIPPYWLLPVRSSSLYFWIYAGAEKVYAVQGTTHYNITRQTSGIDEDYVSGVGTWGGFVFNGVPILNNGSDVPQAWTSVGTTTRLSDLSNWPANTTCNILRGYKNFIVAMDVVKSGNRYQQMVKWSSAADPGVVPSSWDETDSTVEAGETSLSDTPGACVDAVALHDSLLIYKNDSVYSMDYTPRSSFVFRFRKLFDSFGAMARDCIASFEGKHIVLANHDVIVHDTNSYQSILDGRWKKQLFNSIDPNNYRNSFVFANRPLSEIWICYPEQGQTLCTKALIWNWREDKFYERDLPGVSHASAGIVDSDSQADADTWDNDDGTWEDETGPWNVYRYNALKDGLLMAAPDANAIMQLETGEQFNGSNYRSFIMREDLPLTQDPVANFERRKLIKAVWPKVSAPAGAVLNVRVGMRDKLNGPITWGRVIPFTVGTDIRAPMLIEGRIPSIQFESLSASTWELYGYDIEYELTGWY